VVVTVDPDVLQHTLVVQLNYGVSIRANGFQPSAQCRILRLQQRYPTVSRHARGRSGFG
jgi:hypothetical protein